jgi:hypothetical protein
MVAHKFACGLMVLNRQILPGSSIKIAKKMKFWTKKADFSGYENGPT